MKRIALVVALLVLTACGNRLTAERVTPQPTALATRTNAAEGPQPTAAPPTAKPTAPPYLPPTRNPALKAEGVPPKDKDTCPDDYPVKGNIDENGKLYHEKGGRSYAATDPEICFAYVEDAKAAGFTAAPNQ
jgi:hypothetical protein